MNVGFELGQLVMSTVTTDERARGMSRKAIADLTSAAVAGRIAPGSAATLAMIGEVYGAGDVPVWFSDLGSTPVGAAFANATLSSMLDIDDGHRGAAGHPGAGIIPAVLAFAHGRDVAFDRILDAIAIGYEVGVRIAGSRDFSTLDTCATGRWCGAGVAAALCWLSDVRAETCAHAIGLALMVGPRLAPVGGATETGQVKEGIAWASAAGMMAAYGAMAGLKGSLKMLDSPDYDRDLVLGGWGRGWRIEGTYFKLYSCCRWAHAALDGMTEIVEESGLVPQDVAAIDLAIFGRVLSLSNKVRPDTLEEAQYSVPYVLGLCLSEGAGALTPMRPDVLGNPLASEIAAKVRMQVDPALDALFPAMAPAEIGVTLNSGARYERRILAPLGEPTNPLGWDGLRRKQEAILENVGVAELAPRLWSAIVAMSQGDPGHLNDIMAEPV